MSGIQLDGGAEDSAVERREVAVTYRLEKYAVEFLGSSGGGDGADTQVFLASCISFLEMRTHPLTFLASLASQKAALSCTVDECLAIEMLEHAQSLGIRKFVVCDEQADEERLFLWLFNPDTDISWGSILLDTQTGASTSHDQSGKFVTVLWREITPEKPVPGRERHEVLDYPTSAITQIRAVLQGEDEGVPRDGKVVGEWRVGYLRRQ
ncbi:hypothetical protein QFC24_006894 [Naganishia onofrii]|uniref:Uncharacterized protein n=1 Tax=Naganishia onofrii TaxID=1851511 RepID=A0ACC2WXB9_9TREE|nr:hypothetical protein QFC24_006894 [Naganishia onofrii]